MPPKICRAAHQERQQQHSNINNTKSISWGYDTKLVLLFLKSILNENKKINCSATCVYLQCRSLLSSHWHTKWDVFSFTKSGWCLHGQRMRHTLEIPEAEEQGEVVKDFEGKRAVPCKAAARQQVVSVRVYVHIVCWKAVHHLPCLKKVEKTFPCVGGEGSRKIW